MTYTIHSNGRITSNHVTVKAIISLDEKTGCRTLTTRVREGFDGQLPAIKAKIDVTNVFHSDKIGHIVEANLTGKSLPEGFSIGTNKHGECVRITK